VSAPGRVAAVVLAAGRSARMGANKLVEDVAGAPMIARVVDALLGAAVAPIVVVTGHKGGRVRAALAGRAVELVHNPEHARGMGTSLAAGVAALRGCDGALVCLGDMPWIRAEHVRALMRAFDPGRGRAICVPVYRGRRGHPVLLAARFFAAMAALDGDAGARSIIAAHPELVYRVDMGDDAVLIDIDTAAELAAARAR
jgi:molybdenum cofactor cytidylyltransferase